MMQSSYFPGLFEAVMHKGGENAISRPSTENHAWASFIAPTQRSVNLTRFTQYTSPVQAWEKRI